MPNPETIKLIMGRRSIRRFEQRQAAPEDVQILLECAFAAPSSKNFQPCQFILIDDSATLTKISQAAPAAKMVAGASFCIAVCVDVPAYEEKSGLTDGTWIEDASAAMENILLAARALDMEGVWMQVMNRADREGTIPTLLGIPQGVKLLSIAVIGYPAENKAAYSGLDQERLHLNMWNTKRRTD